MAEHAQKRRRRERHQRCIEKGIQMLKRLQERSLSEEELAEPRRALLAGECPLCGEGGFKSIALHVWQIHEVRSRELREILLLTFTESICSPELHDRLSALNAHKNPRLLGLPEGERHISTAGRRVMRANGLLGLASIPSDMRIKFGRQVGEWNRGKRFSPIEHGTFREYRKGCKCDECMQAQRRHWKEWRERRKLDRPNS